LLVVTCAPGWAADWTGFRGLGGVGHSTDPGLPVTWSDTENVIWRTSLPGPGSSGPITVGDRVFITCYSGYALDAADPGDMNNLLRHVVCLNRQDGKIHWTKEFQPSLPESNYSGGNDSWHGYATSTPATDGERLYVFFGKSGVYCLDLEGNQLWHTKVGDRATGWGSGTSVVLHKNLVIVNASVESGAIVAVNRETGQEAWRTGGVRGSWNTPLPVNVPGGGTELVVGVPEKVLGLDPDTGKQLWECEGIPDRGYVVPSVIAHDGIVYAIGGRTNTALAVRAGGRGDVTQSHRLWTTNKGSNVCSPIYHEGYLYWVHERQGVAHCLNATNGEAVYQERLTPRPGIVYASAIFGDGNWYVTSQHAGTYVLSAKPEFELLAHNVFADDNSRTNAAPAVSNGQLLLRSDRYLYCLGSK
ncbi:MAG TPA: PQQ-binding-like beta-propeller repeat protein, partial [Nitrospiraceae bacterium]|nr:PQQ-binding-like beta-propeller repeat protein [Nitrospiraceae bacterium]